jgi:hypothetical protein
MSEVNFDDYDYIFSHQTHNDSFALEFGKLILSLDKWLGATGVLLDAAMLFDDLHSHISFEQWLSDNKTSIADLRFRQGVSATFMLRKYREDIGKEDRTPKVFVHVVPVGFGFDTVSTLTDAIASAPNDDLISQLDPSAQSRVTGKDGNQYFTSR